MTDWAAFAGVTAAVTLLLLALAHASATAMRGVQGTRRDLSWLDPLPDGADHLDVDATPEMAARTAPDGDLSTGVLFANVLASHGIFAAVLLGGAWYAEVPASALGVSPETVGFTELVVGVGFGLALVAANTASGVLAERVGYAPSSQLRELLSPTSPAGWVGLLGVVLPFVALFEELLFRGALIGALSTGYPVSPWMLAILSSVAFAFGHGAQGRAGVAVTGTLGFVLAAGYVLTGSLLVVVIAHYLVNAAEFVVFEGLDVELAWMG